MKQRDFSVSVAKLRGMPQAEGIAATSLRTYVRMEWPAQTCFKQACENMTFTFWTVFHLTTDSSTQLSHYTACSRVLPHCPSPDIAAWRRKEQTTAGRRAWWRGHPGTPQTPDQDLNHNWGIIAPEKIYTESRGGRMMASAGTTHRPSLCCLSGGCTCKPLNRWPRRWQSQPGCW